jgi:hypothetical protein
VPAIEFFKEDSRLWLLYRPLNPGWIHEHLKHDEPIRLRNTFAFDAGDCIPLADDDEDQQPAIEDAEEFAFALGDLVGEYYRVSRQVVGTDSTFHFHESVPLSAKVFVAERNISVLSRIDRMVTEDVFIGGAADGAMPWAAYQHLLSRFPTTHELTLYASARVGACVDDYLNTSSDTETRYQKYLNKRIGSVGSDVLDAFRPQEAAKYRALAAKLRQMLANESSYSEKQWQDEILDIIRLLYPKYILVFSGTPVFDSINKKRRFLDLMLVDSCGNVDLIEIKRPFDKCVVSEKVYRDNYIPLKELIGAVMQIEKYILYLNKWGQQGEDELNKRYSDKLPHGLRLKVINPKGFIILGRENNMTPAQRDDFEVIKRKYANVIDIVTYDDLLSRLDFTIQQLEA